MKRSGHFGLSAILSFPIFIILSTLYTSKIGLISFSLIIGLSKLPDIDNIFIQEFKDAFILFGRRFTLSHRGITHTIYFSIFIGFILSMLSIPIIISSNFMWDLIYISFLSGFLSVLFHCIGDIFTPKGIKYLPPIIPNLSLSIFWYNNIFANMSTLFIGILCIILVFIHYFNSYSIKIVFEVYLGMLILTFICLMIARSWNLRFSDFE
jgi:membrane-bound metal-dependent hydrolase YbcI (DUF457 family)